MTTDRPSGDPVPAITEAEATGEIAAIYKDIRAVTGVPVVNLIWRHLATMEGALPWTWSSVRPLYVSGEVAVAAAHLRANLQLPEMLEWPESVLEAAGLDAEARAGISRVLRSYDRSNAMNMVALSAVLALTRGDSDPAEIPATDPGAEIAGSLPHLLTFGEMPEAVVDLIYRLNAVGDPEHKVIASMYRHLAHWPVFLALVWERLAPLEASGEINRIIARNLEVAGRISRRLAAQIPDGVAPPPPETAAKVEEALTLFTRYAIGRMVPIGRCLAAAFPHAE